MRFFNNLGSFFSVLVRVVGQAPQTQVHHPAGAGGTRFAAMAKQHAAAHHQDYII